MVSVSGGLPGEPTSFVGRRQAVAEVKRLMSASRLVTLTGAGGVGKSRLALRVARDVRRAFPQGAWLIELAKLQDPSLLYHALFEALELRNRSTRALDAVLIEYLVDKRLLLVLDNCEHLLDACSELVSRLLPAAPGVRFLVTSRQSLGVAGEHVWPVPSLSLPDVTSTNNNGELTVNDPRQGSQYESLALFEERATAVLPGFELSGDNEIAVTRLCQRLDGLPLAIELAAVQMRVLSVEEIVARLEDRYRLLTSGNRGALPRHQTLRAAVEWSFDLCSEQERVLWARLSVFAGGFDLQAAESVCADEGMNAQDVFTGVAGLVQKSVLTREKGIGSPARYRMLETIRQFGHERLVDDGKELIVRRQHRDHYFRFAEQLYAGCFGPDQKQWSQRLRLDRANLWRALDFCLTEPGESRAAIRMAAALWYYWIACGCLRDGRYWLGRALAKHTQPDRDRAWALCINGYIAGLQGDIAQSIVLLDESCALARQSGDERVLAHATQFLGMSFLLKGDLATATTMWDRSLAEHRALDELNCLTGIAYIHRSLAAACLGDLDSATDIFRECQKFCAAHGEQWVMSWALWAISFARLIDGDLSEARARIREALGIMQNLDDLLGQPACLDVAAVISAAEGDVTQFARLLGASDAMWRPIGNPRFGFYAFNELYAECETRARRSLGDSAFDAAYEQGAQLTIRRAVGEALGEKTKPSTTVSAPAASAEPSLTRRERETAMLVAKGMSNKGIAEQLVISPRTVECHVEHILVKLGFNTRTQIAAWVRQKF
ncbi:LuxR C-terminal-related transcriptional regulator [Saccharopolyspora sp. ASAGF58]|uniref:LuxR C-terminal-related transcriptional regulator n=1 Tax=Saccharopolyspora sp. ASAGF58 TaxID=2719023 RepID=UPI00143FB984|nr:LuxR C-terminal-related transcriptional regulator [Saccharopolyspora sp. ASAGF58]QIZ38584.1 LuxR family transcriptional regulator [Saccharopolyspora sp. ASAGF58]